MMLARLNEAEVLLLRAEGVGDGLQVAMHGTKEKSSESHSTGSVVAVRHCPFGLALFHSNLTCLTFTSANFLWSDSAQRRRR